MESQLVAALQSQGMPRPSIQWLRTLVQARNPPPPLPALVATAKSRLLASDLTAPDVLDPSSSNAFPANITDQNVRETRIPHDVFVQVLDIENLSRSRWEQVEELEAIERGEQTRGREVIRLPVRNEGDEDGDAGVVDRGSTQTQEAQAPTQARNAAAETQAAKNATHRLTLQDCKGMRVFGMELKRIERIGVGKTSIGEKMLIKAGTTVARGVLLLEPANCLLLGGRVELWQKDWVEKRLSRLRDAVGAGRR